MPIDDVEVAPPEDVDADPVADTEEDAQARWAAIAFGAYLVVAFFVILFVYGDGQWFRSDEWGMLVDRTLDVDGLFVPQNGHWSTFPIFIYQVLYRIFGLDTYVPYLAVTAALHLTLAALLRVVMRRAGVGPWIATVAAGTLVLFGTGYENILFGIQMSMVGSMVFGLTHLLLADHDGPLDRRDALGLLAGALGLMASGIGPPLVIIVGLAVFLRRGWRMAFVHTAPLAAMYLLWFFWQRDAIGGSQYEDPPLGVIRDWVFNGELGVFMGLGQYRVAAIALAVMLVVGLVLAWYKVPLAELRVRASSPLAMLIGGALLFGIVSTQRWILGVEYARASRYVAMAAALTLPALAVAGAALIKRWRYTAPVVVLLFLVGVPGNLEAFSDTPWSDGFYAGQKRFVVGAANAPALDDVSADVLPDPHYFRSARVDVGFLRQAKEDGRLPDLGPVDERMAANIDLRLKLAQNLDILPADAECERFTESTKLKMKEGDRFGITGNIAISQPRPGKLRFKSTYSPLWAGNILEVQVPELVVFLEPAPPETSYEWCTIP